MRIISKFHDYYDSIQREGQDRSLVYLRHPEQYQSHDKANPMPQAVGSWCNFSHDVSPFRKSFHGKSKMYSSTDIYFGLILFAGRLYPYARVVRDNIVPGSTIVPDVFVYDIAELEQYAHEHKQEFYSKWKWNTDRTKIQDFFALKGSERYMDIALREKLVVVYHTGGSVYVNGRLADLEFYRVMPHWQAYQELSMFLGNLAAPNNPMVVISDKSMIAKHGFNKLSFRKQKESK